MKSPKSTMKRFKVLINTSTGSHNRMLAMEEGEGLTLVMKDPGWLCCTLVVAGGVVNVTVNEFKLL